MNNMAKGRPPKTKQQLEATGSKHAKGREEIGKLLSDAPEPPEWLKPVAKEKFTLICWQTIEMRVLTAADLDAVTQYAIEYEAWLEAETKMAQGADRYVETFNPDGSLKMCRASRWQLQSTASHEKMRHLATVLGLTPSDRTRLGYGAAKADESPLAQWFTSDKAESA